jgi:hypothetical protein
MFPSGGSKFCAQNLPEQQSRKAGEGMAEADFGSSTASMRLVALLLLFLLVFLADRACLASLLVYLLVPFSERLNCRARGLPRGQRPERRSVG